MSDSQDNDENLSSDSDHDDESQDSSSDEATGNQLFDLEASEDDSEAGLYEGQNQFDYEDGDCLESFPKFMKLPLELREMVWKAFCPNLTAEVRVFQIHITDDQRPRLLPGPVLEDQNGAMRALLAVTSQTRDMALRSSPHTFSLSGGEVIRYHEERDVIHVVAPPKSGDTVFRLGIQELAGSPKNLAISSDCLDDGFVDVCFLLHDLRRIYILIDDIDLHMQDVPVKDYAWAVSENVYHYLSETQEDGEAGLVTTIKQLFCWPDLDNQRGFAQQNADINRTDVQTTTLHWQIQSCRDMLADPLNNSEELSQDYVTEDMLDEANSRLHRIEVWPMIQFNGDAGLRLFERMKAWDRPFDEWDSGSSDSDDTEEDEYDSEGIDDDSIHDHLSTDDEDDLPGQLPTTSSPGHGTLGRLLEDSEINEHLAAQFSSDEDDEDKEQGHAEESGSDDSEQGSTRPASRHRRPVVASDSDDESATETEEPRPAANRRVRAALADSEDESGAGSEDAPPRPAQGRNRRVRAVPSDSEDESKDDSPQPSVTTQKRRSRALPVDSDDNDDDESDPQEVAAAGPKEASSSSDDSSEESSSEQTTSDEEDDETEPPKRMSLAQRLRMEAERERSGRVDDEDSDVDGNDHSGTSDDGGDGIAEESSSEDDESEEDL